MFRNTRVALAALFAAFCFILHAGDVAWAAEAATSDADALSRARATGNKKRAEQKFYSEQFDLSGLPSYVPEKRVRGAIRQWGNNYLRDSGLMAKWETEFRKHHPGVRFEDNLRSSSVGIPALIAGVADLAPMGRQALWDELKGLEREGADASGAGADEIVEVIVATGSYNVRGWTFALGVFVHKDNPLSGLTLDQLDGILGAERTGGWRGLTWDPSVARGPEKNIRKWGELGLTGEWADRDINVYGYNAKYHFNDEIDKKVLKGSGKWNERLRAYSNLAGLKADGSLTAAGELIMNDLSRDKYGIAYTGIPFLTADTKPLALAESAEGPYVPLTLKTVQNRTYPLIRDVYYYFRRTPGRPVDPKVREFLRYVLSREGQSEIQRDGKYLPLTADVALEQLKKLD